ncbi:NHLP leader peptide family RiPP precursor [Ruegeria sp. 2205SS24-7]|uniref:NHLP leader peptide family RiPP precursor n=1 Tax=Ruegeria discodermiae TaxID=3064389 RepID=UPI0027412F50|nr:NHLP leader peptide family RiPP precursor [Ruegeria sp. 2205SS24-7]MDP5219683.1 NHLP leader peptide family RiPP precursor [Ruegeria sp. 2205SS24-7]
MMMQKSEVNPTQAAKLEFLNKAWTDKDFALQLEEDPKAALAEFGINFPNGVDVRIVRDTATEKYFHIPVAPGESEISDADLLDAQGGTTIICLSGTVSIIVGTSATVTL